MEEMFDGDIAVRIEQEAIHLKACDKFGDPIELNADMARELARKLDELADQIDD